MRVVVTGASGLIGSALVPVLLSKGHRVIRLVRRKPTAARPDGSTEIFWNPMLGQMGDGFLEECEAVIHLAGESIADGRWDEDKKRRVRDSRVKSTRFLAETLAQLNHKPRAFICASATGYYGDRDDEILTEDSAPGTGFLADVCREWEAAADQARSAGIRTLHMRIGMVLSGRGGALQKILTPFKFGLGGKVGNGRQWMSWIALDDVVRAFVHALEREDLSGPVNTVAPKPVTNEEFTQIFGRVLHRPTFMPVPAFALRLAFGEMAEELVLSSARVLPRKLLASGFEFLYPDLESALRHELAHA